MFVYSVEMAALGKRQLRLPKEFSLHNFRCFFVISQSPQDRQNYFLTQAYNKESQIPAQVKIIW